MQGERFTAAEALASPWFSAEVTAEEANARGVQYAAAAGSVMATAEAGLASSDPSTWVRAAAGGSARLVPAPFLASPEEVSAPAVAEDEDDELDAVQAEIARLKAEMGL